jgi:hypothetical protein
MSAIARVPITNVFMGGDYTGVIYMGPEATALNVILDTGSSALAIDASKYSPSATGDRTTHLAQTDAYGDGSTWTGAVINTTVAIGNGSSQVSIPNVNAAVAYQASANMFGATDGILGLAYAPLDDAFTMPDDTWAHQYTSTEVRAGVGGTIPPYLTQLASSGVVSDILAFRTRRSFVHEGGGGASDPLNQGWMIVGGGVEATDLYTGAFQTVKVLSDEWYCTNLKEVIVGSSSPITARLNGPKGMPTNSIIDSGTNSLNLGSQMLHALISKFTPPQQAMLHTGVAGRLVPTSELNLASWPTISFILQGDTADVRLDVAPENYWQVDTQQVGAAALAITTGQPGLAILGLPIMNGYFTVFDGEADGGRGAIRFATAAG